MKGLQLALVGLMLAGTAAVAPAQDAQPQSAPRPAGGRMMAALMQGLTLTADQQARVDAIAKKYSEARQTLLQDQSLDQDARRARMREAMGKQSEEIKTVLTDDQKKIFEKNQADMQARMQAGGQRPPQE